MRLRLNYHDKQLNFNIIVSKRKYLVNYFINAKLTMSTNINFTTPKTFKATLKC